MEAADRPRCFFFRRPKAKVTVEFLCGDKHSFGSKLNQFIEQRFAAAGLAVFSLERPSPDHGRRAGTPVPTKNVVAEGNQSLR
jgi:hypothetical protein